MFQASSPVVEYNAPAPAVVQAPTPVVEFLAPAPAVILAPVEEYISPVPVVDAVSAPVMEFIAPSAHTQFFFSLSLASSDTETHFPGFNGNKSRKGIETPTGSSRFRPVDEAGHVLDVQVERVMRASVARLGYEWRRTKGREKQLAGTLLLHLSHELQSCLGRRHTVTLLGLLAGARGPIPALSAIAGVVSRVGSLAGAAGF